MLLFTFSIVSSFLVDPVELAPCHQKAIARSTYETFSNHECFNSALFDIEP